MTKSTALTNPRFDDSKLSKDDKSKLIYFQGQLSRSRTRIASELIKYGEILHGAQEVLADHSSGVFHAWLKSVGLSTSSTYRAIAAYVEFGGCPNLGQLEVSAMYALAANEAAKKKALKLADKGIKVTHAMARQLIDASPPKGSAPTPAPSDAPESPETAAETDPPTGSSEAATACLEAVRDAQTPDPEPCPNCLATKWEKDEDGDVSCAKCHHPWGEPAGDVDEDRITTQRQKTVKTGEALLRAIDDMQHLCPKPKKSYDAAVNTAKGLIAVTKEWK